MMNYIKPLGICLGEKNRIECVFFSASFLRCIHVDSARLDKNFLSQFVYREYLDEIDIRDECKRLVDQCIALGEILPFHERWLESINKQIWHEIFNGLEGRDKYDCFEFVMDLNLLLKKNFCLWNGEVWLTDGCKFLLGNPIYIVFPKGIYSNILLRFIKCASHNESMEKASFFDLIKASHHFGFDLRYTINNGKYLPPQGVKSNGIHYTQFGEINEEDNVFRLSKLSADS